MKKVSLDDDALAELMDSVAWYEERQEGQGTKLLEAVHASLRALPHSKLKQLKTSKVHGMKFVEVGRPWPFRIIVIEDDDNIYVVAVAHHRRDADYWAGRSRQ